ncbi:MAG: SH3 domain-containing protein [Planctomycetota bacterium]
MLCVWAISLLIGLNLQSAPSELSVAQVVNGPVNLVSGADERFPVLAQANDGDLLVVVDVQSSWSRVQVPNGFTGWVHGKYVTRTEKGRGTVNANDVNFRVEPSSTTSNLPVGTMARGAELFILGERGDWLQVSAPPELTLWLPSAHLPRVGALADFTPRLQEARRSAEQRWLAAVGGDAGSKPAPPSDVLASIKDQVEKAKTDASVNLAAAAAELKTMLDGKPAGTSATAAGDLLAQIGAIEKDRKERALAGAKPAPAKANAEAAVSASKPATASPESPAPVPAATNSAYAPAPGSKYVAVGWVSAARDPQAAVYLRKGGYITFRLSCPDGRYRLHDFADREVGVTGRVINTPGIEPMVEVDSVEILRK